MRKCKHCGGWINPPWTRGDGDYRHCFCANSIPESKTIIMNEIPTALDFYRQNVENPQKAMSIERAFIEFTKLHVEAALKKASKQAKLHSIGGWGTYENPDTVDVVLKEEVKKNNYGHGDCTYEVLSVDENSILNAYPLTNIK